MDPSHSRSKSATLRVSIFRVKARQLHSEVQKIFLDPLDRNINLTCFFSEVLMSSWRRNCDRSARGKLPFLLGRQRSDFDWVFWNDNLLVSGQLLYSREYFFCLWVSAKALVQASHDGLIRWRGFGGHDACFEMKGSRTLLRKMCRVCEHGFGRLECGEMVIMIKNMTLERKEVVPRSIECRKISQHWDRLGVLYNPFRKSLLA